MRLCTSSRLLIMQVSSRVSWAVRKVGGVSASGTMPTRCFSLMGSVFDTPAVKTVPVSCISWPVSTLSRVVFPAPLGPKSPKNAPSSTFNETLCSTVVAPKFLDTSLASMTGMAFTVEYSGFRLPRRLK